MSSASQSAGMAFSTGTTCMPMPAPPGGTISVTPARGRKAMRSKKFAMTGCSSHMLGWMTMSSALPGTNMSSTQRFSWLGFLPSRFSQWYSTRPVSHRTSSAFSSLAVSILLRFWMTSKVTGLRFLSTSATSSASAVALMPNFFSAICIAASTPQYSGALVSILSTPSITVARSVISLHSLKIFSSLVIVRHSPFIFGMHMTKLIVTTLQ